MNGYLSCDLPDNYSGVTPDIACDLRRLPFDDDFADEILAVHVLEHFYVWEAADVLMEWRRVLKPGGKMIIEVPCMDKVIKAFTNPKYKGNPPVNMTWWPLYGDPGYETPEMVHKWCYGINQLQALIKTVGFEDVQHKEAKYHIPIRDMRMEAIK